VVSDSSVRVRAYRVFRRYRHATNRIEHLGWRGMNGVVVLVFCHFAPSGARLLYVLSGVRIKFPLAACATEVVGLSLVLALPSCLLWIYLHSANDVFFHGLPSFPESSAQVLVNHFEQFVVHGAGLLAAAFQRLGGAMAKVIPHEGPANSPQRLLHR